MKYYLLNQLDYSLFGGYVPHSFIEPTIIYLCIYLFIYFFNWEMWGLYQAQLADKVASFYKSLWSLLFPNLGFTFIQFFWCVYVYYIYIIISATETEILATNTEGIFEVQLYSLFQGTKLKSITNERIKTKSFRTGTGDQSLDYSVSVCVYLYIQNFMIIN